MWNVTEVEHYEGLFFSATMGFSLLMAPLSYSLLPLRALGLAWSFFWSPLGKKPFGTKVGSAVASTVGIYGGAASWYFKGSPIGLRGILEWFQNNVQPPSSSDPVKGTIELYRNIAAFGA